jgi:hypothetical protein
MQVDKGGNSAGQETVSERRTVLSTGMLELMISRLITKTTFRSNGSRKKLTNIFQNEWSS